MKLIIVALLLYLYLNNNLPMKNIIKITLACLLALFLDQNSYAQKTWPLYPGAIPNSKNCPDKEIQEKTGRNVVRNVTVPTLAVFMPEKIIPGMPAVIICPGGAFFYLHVQTEGSDVAKWLNKKGVSAFVLKYRLIHCETAHPVSER